MIQDWFFRVSDPGLPLRPPIFYFHHHPFNASETFSICMVKAFSLSFFFQNILYLPTAKKEPNRMQSICVAMILIQKSVR